MRDTPPRTPVWKAIADALRGDIVEGRYRSGEKLPTEAALAERFGVNRHTVRHGLSSLVEEGLVRTRRGAGAFVTSAPTDYPIGQRVRFHENLIAAGRRPDKMQGDPVCAYHGLSLADGQPIAIFESVFPLSRLPCIVEALGHTSGVTRALQIAGVSDYTRASTRLTAMRATATQALHLQLSEGAPLLRSTGVNVDASGVPVEFGRTWFAGDRVTLTLDNQGANPSG